MPRRSGRHLLRFGAVAALVVAADELTKALVVARLAGHPPVRVLGGLAYLVYARNTGAAFSLAAGQTVLLSLVALAVVVAIGRAARRIGSAAWASCLGLILGGAAGNLVDRLVRSPGPLRGAVVDWISLLDPTGRVWPVFNLADASLVAGVCLAVLLEATGRRLDGSRSARRRG